MKKPLKVAHIVFSLGTGGLEKVVIDTIQRFDKSKVMPFVYCTGRKGKCADLLEKNNVKVSLLNGRKYPLKNAFLLAQIFRKEKIDIVHSHSGVYRDATLAAMLANIPIIVHTDHGKFYPDSKWSRFNHWLFSHFRDRVIAVSDELRNFMINDIGIKSDKVIRIYNGANTTNHSVNIDISKKKQELGIPLSDKSIGIVARLAPVKDHRTLFLAFNKVRKEISNVKLLIVGDGVLMNALKKQATDLGEQDNIIFLGKRFDIDELLQIMDVVCLSSLSEGLSITLTEAMAMGKAVVATSVGGNPELVVDGVSGLLVAPKNPKQMADAIIKLLKDDNLRKSMGNEAKKRIKEKFNIEDTTKEYEELYFSLARQKGIL